METFEAVIESEGWGAWVTVPENVVAALGGKGRIPVNATIDGIAYRGSIASMKGGKVLGILREIRDRLGKQAGDPITVTVELDTAERRIDPPGDLAAALDAAGLRDAYERLSYTHQRETVRAIEQAKKPETRSRRIDQALDRLRTQ